jgi:acyl-CoA reductase-like NAD-dependent aldehyde dehydrogenase
VSSATDDKVFIDGAFVPAKSSARVGLVNPATEEVFAEVALADEEDVDLAVAAAARALPAWADTSPAERASLFEALADGIVARAAEMDRLVTQENGAPAWWASYVGSGGSFIYRGAAHLVRGFEREEVRESPAGRSIFRNDPVGVVAAIVPWNSPQVLIASKLAPALGAGCTVVLKPSPETSLDALMLAEIIDEVGFPAGVVNVVTGGRDTGAALVRHLGVSKVSFTGSTVAGREIASVCGSQLKPVSAELGGKSAVVLLEGADLGAFADSIVSDLVPYSGQVCYANTRVLVHRSRYDEVVQCIRSSFENSPVGDPSDPATIYGPLVTAVQRDKVEGYIAAGVADGARIVCGGGRPAGLDKGYYVEPTIFVDVRPEMSIFQEEIFGPVVVIVPFSDDDEAVALANNSNYGLAGAVFDTDLEHANAVARRMETGRIIVNNAKGASRYSSLYKASGLGSVGDMNPSAFVQPKNITQPA